MALILCAVKECAGIERLLRRVSTEGQQTVRPGSSAHPAVRMPRRVRLFRREDENLQFLWHRLLSRRIAGDAHNSQGPADARRRVNTESGQ
jgi:hypothetical protein